ncbi:MAG: PaaI family thioesterase [Gemmatimonadales bacterium]|nr:PaaI family thioesterase [Gemmatimonadales bacterium]NIN11062.1 PaaI family thioesterase [Gemmatimonadales bacterium]NIN49659.1 PaaI family thioesterase [Gemmatimonadales bacterium]NIP07123.1 PaaI family thioesterase [Gemmatimonadales bacterium]NIQ99514.1 PaaI family thioesterase [Gemmatimonadales bacterium]
MNPDQQTWQLSETELAQIQKLWNEHPGMEHLGARVDLSTPGTVRAVVDPIQPHHRGGLGTDAVNGATIAGVFDLAIGLAGYLHTVGRRAGVAQLGIQYLRPVIGDRLQVEARAVRVGKTLIFSTAELRDEQGVVCSRCDGILAVSGGDAGPGPVF